MTTPPIALARKLSGFAAYAYRTLLLTFLLISTLRLLTGDGGWINDFAVLLILSVPLALATGLSRARRG
jgi:hypothetical protein